MIPLLERVAAEQRALECQEEKQRELEQRATIEKVIELLESIDARLDVVCSLLANRD